VAPFDAQDRSGSREASPSPAGAPAAGEDGAADGPAEALPVGDGSAGRERTCFGGVKSVTGSPASAAFM
jgi:hypothetical protein